jgi:hypothetical protein
MSVWYEMLKHLMHQVRSRIIIVAVHVGAVKLYVPSVEALRENGKEG